MPLKSGSTKKVVSENIKEMMRSGHPQEQAVAASLAKARETAPNKFPKLKKMIKKKKEE